MKKILFPLVALMAIVACKDDDKPMVEPGFATDNLVLKEEKNVLLHMSAPFNQPSSASLGVAQQIIEKEYPGRVITTMAFSDNPILSSETSDSLNRRLGSQMISLTANGEDALGLVPEDYEDLLMEKPLASAAHKGGENDTAWYTDVKIKLWKDTSTVFLFVNSYLLSDFEATGQDTTSLDLTLPSFEGAVQNVNNRSLHDRDYVDVDSNIIVSKGDLIVHNDVVLFGNPHFQERGVNIALDVNPFKQEFFAGDVLGTESTPIRVYIQKPDDLDPDLEELIEPEFLTVVWFYDFENTEWVLVNSFQGK